MYEYISSMKPLMPSDSNKELEDLAIDLKTKSQALSVLIKPRIRDSLAKLVRSMNCYYSNLIEGHNTHPRDIDNALNKDYSLDSKKRNLQLEATAHIEVQEMIDEGFYKKQIVSTDFITWIHEEFTKRLPEELLLVKSNYSGKEIKVSPGEFRDDNVQVGYHIPPRYESLNAFLERFIEAYTPDKLSTVNKIFAAAASHHRLLWVHPFFDANGRVARLFSHSYLKEIGIGSSLWSVSRGFSRRVTEYRNFLMEADSPRQGDLDGRGNLSLRGLENFCKFFLESCIDQVEFMSSLLEPHELEMRMSLYIKDEINLKRLPEGSFSLLREALLAGEFERGKAPLITGFKERKARMLLSSLVEKGLLVSDSPKGAVTLGFPLDLVERCFPMLYPM